MPRVNKIKRDKAISALRKAGMDPSTAASLWKLLDLSAPLADQITALAEEDPELFGLDADGNPLDDTEDDEPMTAREARAARLRGGSAVRTFRRPATERKSTASASAQEAAAFLQREGNPPPTRRYVEPVRDINAGTPRTTREPGSSAQALAARLRGNA